MGGISIGGIYAIAIRFFRQHRVQRHRVGSRHRSIHLAGTPPSVAPQALRPLLILHSFRFIGLAFVVPGVVSPDLPSAFAHAAAYGDIIAATVAMFSLLLLPSGAGVVAAWMFNIWGAADIFNAFYQANHAGVLAGQLGAAFFIPTLIVPLLLITHGLSFRILLQRENAPVTNRVRQTA